MFKGVYQLIKATTTTTTTGVMSAAFLIQKEILVTFYLTGKNQKPIKY